VIPSDNKNRKKLVLLALLVIVFGGGFTSFFYAVVFNWFYFFSDGLNPSNEEIKNAISEYVIKDAAKDAVLSSHGIHLDPFDLPNRVSIILPIEILEKGNDKNDSTVILPYRVRATYVVVVSGDKRYKYTEESICYIRPGIFKGRGRYIWEVVKKKVISRNEYNNPVTATTPTTSDYH